MTAARFEVRRSSVMPDLFVIVDTDTDRITRRRGFPGHGTRELADEHAGRLNELAGSRKVCRQCRHMAPALTVVDGNCPDCRASDSRPPPRRARRR